MYCWQPAAAILCSRLQRIPVAQGVQRRDPSSELPDSVECPIKKGISTLTDHLDTFSVSKLGIDLLVKIAEKNSGQLFGLVGDPLAKLKASLTVNFSDYFTSAVDKCSRTSTLFDRSKSVPLDSLYITTRLLHSHTILSDVKFRNLLVTISHGEAIRTFLVLGSAGTGKTFFFFFAVAFLETPRKPPLTYSFLCRTSRLKCSKRARYPIIHT